MEWFCISRAATPSRPLYFHAAKFSSFSGTIYRDPTIKQQQTHLRYGSGYQGEFPSQKVATKKFNMKPYNGGKSPQEGLYMFIWFLQLWQQFHLPIAGWADLFAKTPWRHAMGVFFVTLATVATALRCHLGGVQEEEVRGQLPLVMPVLDLLFVLESSQVVFVVCVFFFSWIFTYFNIF